MAFDAGAIKSTMELDRSPFRQGLQQTRREAQRFARTRWTARVDVDTSRARENIRQLRGDLRNLGALTRHFEIHANTGDASAQLKRLQSQTQAFARSGGQAQVGVNTAATQANLRALQAQVASTQARLRQLHQVRVRPRVDTVSVTRAAAATRQLREQINDLDRTTGRPKVSGESIRDAEDDVSGLRRSLLGLIAMRWRVMVRVRTRGTAKALAEVASLAAAAQGLSGPLRIPLMIGGVTAALGALSQLGSGLMAVVRGVGTATGALLVLPAVIAAAVAGGLVLKTAFDGFSAALSEDAETAEKALAALPGPAADAARAVRDLRSSFDGVTEGIQSAFFAGLAPRLSLLGDALLPAVGRGAAQVAVGLNSVAHSVLEFAGAAQTARDTETVLNNTATAFSILGPAAGFFLSALRDITAVGSAYLPGMAQHITTSAQRFAEFIANARSAGDINRWIEDGVAAWRDLRDIAGSTWRIITGIFDGLRGTDAPMTLAQVRDSMASLEAIILGPAFQGGLQAFADLFRGNLAGAAGQLDTIRDAFDLLRPALELLVSGSGSYFVSWVATVSSVLAVLSPLLVGVAWVFDLLSPVLGVIGGALSLLGTYLLIARVAMVAFNGVLTIMNALAYMNPIGLIVIALIALAAVVWYAWNNFDWFRTGVLAVWDAISAGAMWLWTNGIQPVVNWIVDAWTNYLWPAIQFVFGLWLDYIQFLGSIVLWLWTNVVSPVINWIVAAWTNYLWPAIQFVVGLWVTSITTMWQIIQTLWSFIWPIIQFIALVAFALIVTALGLLWGAWKIAFNAIAALVTWLWTNAVKPVVDWIVNAWNTYLVPALLWVRTQWRMVMDGLSAALRWLWTNVVSPVLGWIVERFMWLYTRYQYYRALLAAVFTSIGLAIGIMRDRFRTAIDRIIDFGKNLLSSFRGVRDSVGEIFKKMANFARTPINFVISTVYNDGIRKVARSVLNAVGMSTLADKIPHAPLIPAFAGGGPVMDPAGFVRGRGSGTSDEIDARIANREFVVNARSTARYRPVLEWINNAGRRSTGRSVAPDGVPAFNQGGAVSALSIAKGAFLGGAKGAMEEALEALGWNGWVSDLKAGSPVWEGAAGGALGKVTEGLLSFLGKEDAKGGGVVGVVNQARKATMGGSDYSNEYTQAFGMAGQPWCAMFVSEMIKRAKAQSLYKNTRSAAVASFANSGMRSVGVGAGKPGDLAVYRGSGPGNWAHINIVTDPKKRESIGGNESNRIRTQTGYYSSRAAKLMRPGLAQGGIPDEAMRNILGQDYDQNTRSTTPLATQFYRVLSGLPAYGSGGTASSGPALVGEQGPEMVEFGARARVRTAAETSEVLAEAIVRAMERMGHSSSGPATAAAASVVVNGLATEEVIEEIVRRLRAQAEMDKATTAAGMAPKPKG